MEGNIYILAEKQLKYLKFLMELIQLCIKTDLLVKPALHFCEVTQSKFWLKKKKTFTNIEQSIYKQQYIVLKIS